MKIPRLCRTISFTFVFASLIAGLCHAQNRPAYETENWSPGRTLIWAHPGRSGLFTDPNQWRRPDGLPATTVPDRNTDILLPAASEPYTVKGERTDQVRHATIEENGILSGSHRNEVEIWGNTHVKPGGFARYISIRGDKHTFFRVDESEYPSEENGQVFHHPSRKVSFEQLCRSHLGHKFQVCKFGTASVEFIGKLGVSDEIMLQHGRMIVNGEFRYSGVTGKGALEIYDGAILELQSGAKVAPIMPSNRKAVYNINIYRNGAIQAGSPERPLTSDAYLLLGFVENDQPGRSGIYSALGSMMRVYSSDPEKARLVISATLSDPNFRDAVGKRIGDPSQVAQGNRGIALQLAGDIQLDGVHFDYLSRGGIGLVGGRQPESWKHVTWGTHNAGQPSVLYSELAVNPNAYYHGRNDQKSEWALTERAVALMEDYLAETDPFRLATTPANTIIEKVAHGKNAIETPVAKVFKEPIEVTITTRIPGASMRYTLDGTEPTRESPPYRGPIRIDQTSKICVKAYKPGVGFSPVFSTTYVFE